MNDLSKEYDFDDVFAEFNKAKMPLYPDLKGKHVFITGGGSGIGAYFTAAFALQGAQVSFVSLTAQPAEALCEMIVKKGAPRPLFTPCDIRDLGHLKKVMQDVANQYGPIDVLINNAARDTRHTVDDLTTDQWQDSLDTNLRPHFFTIQNVAASMKQKRAGAIINVGSNSANLGLAGYPAYVAAKAAIVGLSKATARELGEHDIRVNSLIPGWVLTERQKRLWVNDDDLQQCLKQQSLKHPMNGWDIAWPALFLASSSSNMYTGQEMIVDGGRV